MVVSVKTDQKAVTYLEQKQITQILEALITGLVYKKPDDPIAYLQESLTQLKTVKAIHWDSLLKGVDVADKMNVLDAASSAEARNVLFKSVGNQNKKKENSPEVKVKEQIVDAVVSNKPTNKTSPSNIIFVLGGPGSGKGTQCDRLKVEFQLAHISVGDLLRAEVAKKSNIGLQIDGLMKEGKIVPLDITLSVLEIALAEISNPNGVLIDGFPREMLQATEFEKKIGKAKFALYFECSESVLEKRLLKRGETSGRSDDNIEAIKKRFKTFVEQSKPVVDWYEKEGRLVKISSEQPVEDVYQEARKAFLNLQKPTPKVYFVLGGPGSGKGTQCDRLKVEFKLAHVSVGDLLRAEVAKQSEIGLQIDGLMKEGKIVPFEITLSVLEKALSEINNPNGVLVDGFPREMIQATEFERKIGKAKFALYFECSESVLEQRLLKRGETSGRSDDNIEAIKKRFKTFVDQSKPVVDWYEKEGRLVKISSEHPVEEVYAEARKAFL